MSTTVSPSGRRRLVLAGAGHSHLAVLQRFARYRPADTEIVLINGDKDFYYTGALSAWLAGQRHDLPTVPLAPLCERASIHFQQGLITGLDADRRQLLLNDGSRVDYDLLSLNVGGSPRLSLPGTHPRLVPVKPLHGFISAWQDLLDRAAAGTELPGHLSFVGAGATGTELALCAAARLQAVVPAAAKRPSLHLFTGNPLPVMNLPRDCQRRVLLALRRSNVIFHPRRTVTALSATGLVCGQDSFPSDHVFLCSESRPPAWLADSGLDCDAQGYARVSSQLQSFSHPEVFVSGDNASLLSAATAHSGVNAVRQGPILGANLYRRLGKRSLLSFHPQATSLVLLNTGHRHAIASRGSWAAEGQLWWWLKRWIDWRYLQRYTSP